MADPISIHIPTGIAHAADEIEEWSKGSLGKQRMEKATSSPPIEPTSIRYKGSPASSSAGIAKHAGDQHTGQLYDISQEPAASKSDPQADSINIESTWLLSDPIIKLSLNGPAGALALRRISAQEIKSARFPLSPH